MSLAECQHCITKVIFSETNICPSCGKDRNVNPEKSKETILAEQEKKRLEMGIAYYKRNGPKVMLSGILLILSVVIVGFIIRYRIVILLIGLLAGVGMVERGYSQVKKAEELQYEYDEKFK